MKRKTLLTLLILTISATLLSACKSAEPVENSETIETTAVEFEATEETDYDSNTEESKVELLPWLQLASLETHPELRAAFEEYVGVTGTTGNKEGILYTNPLTTQADQNITLLLAIKNSQFRGYVTMPDALEKLGEIAAENYTDIEADDVNAPYATINAYFELLPDQEDGQFDGDSTISRAQAMTLVMRATTPVNESQAPDEDADFTKAVGETQYTNFAAPMNEYTYLNTENGLNDKTFNTTMSRGEYIYLLTKSIFSQSNYNDYLDGVGMEDESLSEDVKLTTVKDGGDISLQDAINNVENGLPTDMYQTLARAVALGFITEDNLNWDEAITKSEAVTLFIDAAETYQTNMEEVNNKMGLGETPPYEVVEQGDYPDSRSDHQKAWDDYKESWDDFSVYGTATKGKTENDFPYYGPTGYDVTLLEERTTDKGYTVMYDTNTGKVYYSGMMLPTGSIWDDTESGGVIATYAYSKDYNSTYDVTYSEMQEVLGVYNGD